MNGHDIPAEMRDWDTNSDVSRRDFLNEIIASAFGLAGVGATVLTYQYLSPNALFEPPLTFRAGTPDLYPVNSVTYIAEQAVYIVHVPEGFYAVSAICTHLGCITEWNPDARLIACPCHGSKFRTDGANIEGPAPSPLNHWGITLTPAGELLVNKAVTVTYGQPLKA
jgi:cytochrome b6-f complex iron-sulfur subunit